MKKEIYKLILVFMIIIISFSIAFFLGREITLKGIEQQSIQNLPSPVLHPIEQESKIKEVLIQPHKTPHPEKSTQKEKVIEYQKKLINKDSKPTIIPKQKEISTKHIKNIENQIQFYGLFIASYKSKEQAMHESTQLKIRFPFWKIFFKKVKRKYKIYIGPFNSKKSAEFFLSEIPKKKEFSSIKIEGIIRSNKKNRINN